MSAEPIQAEAEAALRGEPVPTHDEIAQGSHPMPRERDTWFAHPEWGYLITGGPPPPRPEPTTLMGKARKRTGGKSASILVPETAGEVA